MIGTSAGMARIARGLAILLSVSTQSINVESLGFHIASWSQIVESSFPLCEQSKRLKKKLESFYLPSLEGHAVSLLYIQLVKSKSQVPPDSKEGITRECNYSLELHLWRPVP